MGSVMKSEVWGREKVVLFLGRITFQKGPEYFVRAARIVVDHLPNVRFVMAGTGDLFPSMVELAADLEIGKFFHYTGFLNQEAVNRIYQISDLYVMPSVSEPFGIAPLEAMKNGVPVIVSKQCGVREILPDSHTLDFWDVEKLAHRMIEILADDELAAGLVEQGLDTIGGMGWDVSAALMEDAYASILH